MEIEKRLTDLENKINSIYVSVEKTRKYILWTVIATVALAIIPLLALVFVIPSFIKSIGSLGILGL